MRRPDDLRLGEKPAPDPLRFVQGFVNTVDIEAGKDDFDSAEGLAGWLVRHGFMAGSEAVTEDDRDAAVAFREALRELLAANHGEPVAPDAVRVLRELGSSAPLRLAFDARGRTRLEPATGGVTGALAILATLVHHAMQDGTWERLKVCRNDACRWAFYDASRNRSGSWCSMEVCGNRMKVRAHRRRHADDAAQ